MALAVEKLESVIEERFAAALEPMLAEGIELEPQAELPTSDGNFRGDLIVRAAGRVVLIECDGRKYHDFVRDRTRDLSIMADTDVTDILRVRGCDIWFDMDGTMEAARRSLPFLFTDAQPISDSFDSIGVVASAMIGATVKPIHRLKIDGTMKARSGDVDNPAITVMNVNRSTRKITLQLKSPFWDWNYRAPKAWSMGDLCGLVIEELF